MDSAINLKAVSIGGPHSARMFKPNIDNIMSRRSIPIRHSGTSHINAGAVYLVSKGALDMDHMEIHPEQVMELVQHRGCREGLKNSGLRTRGDNLYDPDKEEVLNAVFGKLLFPLPEFFVSLYTRPELHEAAESSIKSFLAGDLEAIKRYNQTKMNLLSIQGLDVSGTFLSFMDLKGVNLSYADFSGAFLTGANLENSNCTYTNFTSAHLAGAVLRNSVLACAFYGADLRGADLSGSKLKDSNFTGAKLRNANLSNCDLTGIDFKWMDLREAILTGTNLNGVPLDFSDLRGADLSGLDLFSVDLETVKLDGARISISNKELLPYTVLKKNPDIDWVTQ